MHSSQLLLNLNWIPILCLNGNAIVNLKPQYLIFQELLEFIDCRAQASETSVSLKKTTRGESQPNTKTFSKPVPSFAASSELTNQCVLCKPEKHPLYACPRFKSLFHMIGNYLLSRYIMFVSIV